MSLSWEERNWSCTEKKFPSRTQDGNLSENSGIACHFHKRKGNICISVSLKKLGDFFLFLFFLLFMEIGHEQKLRRRNRSFRKAFKNSGGYLRDLVWIRCTREEIYELSVVQIDSTGSAISAFESHSPFFFIRSLFLIVLFIFLSR